MVRHRSQHRHFLRLSPRPETSLDAHLPSLPHHQPSPKLSTWLVRTRIWNAQHHERISPEPRQRFPPVHDRRRGWITEGTTSKRYGRHQSHDRGLAKPHLNSNKSKRRLRQHSQSETKTQHDAFGLGGRFSSILFFYSLGFADVCDMILAFTTLGMGSGFGQP